MEYYKLATKQKLRFQTSKGLLTVEQLWDLSLMDLDALAVSLEVAHQESGGKSFLKKKSEKDRTAKLRFDIVLDVLGSKVEESDAAREAFENKEHNQRILGLIAEKKEEALKNKSIKELESMIKKVGA